MIDKRIFIELKSKLGIQDAAVYTRIDKRRESMGFIISKEQAAALLASEYGIDVSKYLKEQELTELRSFKSQSPTIIKTVISKHKIPSIKIIDLGNELQIHDSLLPTKIIQEAVEMARVYPKLYTFENSLRNVISIILFKKHGEKWWETKVNPKIQDKVEERIKKETDNPWHGKRSSAPIFYTDIGHLLTIIRSNWNDFKDFFPNQSWIETRINEIEISRNIVAHNNPLTKRDIQRLSIYFDDWERQIDSIKEKV